MNAQLPTRADLEAMLLTTEAKLLRGRAALRKWEYELTQLTRSERRSRGGAKLVARIENAWAVVNQLEPIVAGVREQLGRPPLEPAEPTRVPCECTRRPAAGGLEAVTWNPDCPLHGFRR